MLIERLPTLSTEELMVFAGIPTDQLLHTRAAQDLLERGRQQPQRVHTARIQALPLEQLELLAEALLDFSGPTDLQAWLDNHAI